ncbi:MAG: phage antirepressor KilAC domain-containing protein [Butyricicoccus porcorum]|nr:phage antirepressor KilAC domain-containing protein [Butyricicoccus porcorum]
MNKIKVFENPEFGSIRTVEQDGEPWLAGKDVAAALGYSNPRDAISKHVDDEDKGVAKCDTLGGNQNMTIINESGLYSLILSSRLPTAKKFKHWVTSEVLPSIRKTGGYISGQENMSDSELMAKALLVAQRQINQRDARIAEMQPKALFADSVAASKTSILIGELAKILKQNGVENMGQNRLFEWLRSNGYLIRRKGTDYNMPTQRAMELKLFEIKETVVSHADGHQTINKTPKVTGKGQQYFINAFLGGILRQPLHTD